MSARGKAGSGPPGRLRIVSGARRGFRIRVPSGGDVRPTGERVREAVFDVLGPVEGLSVLDLFAGSGALGLEALSRGAERCTFVEADRSTVRVLAANVEALGMADRSEILGTTHDAALSRFAAAGRGFELLFVDPPYTMLAKVEPALRAALPLVMRPGAVVVVEGPPSLEIDLGMDAIFSRRYGRTLVTMIEKGTGDL